MSIWGKVIGGVAGFAIGGPIGALLGAFAGHAMDKARAAPGEGAGIRSEARQVAFTVAVIVLAAKMAKADGHVSRKEIAAFRQIFHVPPEEVKNVGRLFDQARKDATGFEPYAKQIARMFANEPAVLEELLAGLLHIAKADGVIHPAEQEFLQKVATIFGFDARAFESVRASHMAPGEADPYEVLGLGHDATDAEVKSTYRKLIREYHPDTLISKGLPQEFIDLTNEKMAAINAAYDRVQKQRGLK
jgi:DnaJ like chaperone protein